MRYAKYASLRYMASFSALSYAQAFLSAGITLFIARSFSIETFADFRFGMLCMVVVSVFGIFGAGRSLLIEIVHGREVERALKDFWIIRVLLSLIGVALVTLWTFARHDMTSTTIAVLFSAVGLIVALRSPGWFDAEGRLRQHTVILLVERIFFGAAVGILAIVLAVPLGVLDIGVILLFSSTVFLIVEIAIILRNSDREKLLGEPLALRRLYGTYHWVWYHSLANMLRTSIGQLVMDDQTDRVALGFLGIAMQFATILRLFMQQLARLRAASIAEFTAPGMSGAVLAQAFRRDIQRTLGLGVLLTALYGSVSGVLIIELLGDRYQPAVPINWVLSVWALVAGVGLIANRYVIGLGLQRPAFFIGLFWGAVALALILALSARYGALGYAWILLGCTSGSVVCQIYLAWRAIPRRDAAAKTPPISGSN